MPMRKSLFGRGIRWPGEVNGTALPKYGPSFRTPIAWEKMRADYGYLLAIDAALFLVGLAAFYRRDFKS